ncbi:MAG TPA: sulfotransferase domain-containing protein [Candidatus Limnocylindrales bacterium]
MLCVSIPKAGTHLLERALCLHPRLYRKLLPTVSEENVDRWNGVSGLLAKVRSGQVVASHLRFRPGYPDIIHRRGVRAIFLIRDPRDIVVSQVHYVSKRTDHRLHTLFDELPDVQSRLRLAIAGDAERGVVSIGDRLDLFAGWLDTALVVRFEDLVGPDGGGSRELQMTAIRSIYDFLRLDLDEPLLASIADRLFSADSPTFRSGAIGGWRRSFDPAITALFNETVRERVRPYGYRLSDDLPGARADGP